MKMIMIIVKPYKNEILSQGQMSNFTWDEPKMPMSCKIYFSRELTFRCSSHVRSCEVRRFTLALSVIRTLTIEFLSYAVAN